MSQAPSQGLSPRAILGWAFLIVFTLVLGWAAGVVGILGIPYYVMPVDTRHEHALAEWYGSGRILGLLFGIAGAGLMVIMLLYSVRKWLSFMSFMGSNQFWMRFHMLCGLLGPLYILFHAELKMPQGFIAIGFWCMIFVAVSGFFGRYLFGYFPATAADLKLDLQEAQKRLTELRAQLVTDTQSATAEQVAAAVKLARDIEFEPRTLGELLVLDADVRRRADHIRIMLFRSGIEPQARKRAESTLVQQLELRRSMAGFDVARRLLRYWNLFHQPLAIAMYIISAIHILNAVLFGGSIAVLFGGF